MSEKSGSKIQVDKQNIEALFYAINEGLSDILYSIELQNENNRKQVKELVEERIADVRFKMNRVWNPVVRDLKNEQKILYSMYLKNKDTQAGVEFYKEYLDKKKQIEAYERGEIDF